MNRTDSESGIVEIETVGDRDAGDEANVFADLNGFEVATLPSALGVQERAEPCASATAVRVAEGLVVLAIDVVHGCRARALPVGIAHGVHLRADAGWRIPVVVVPVGDPGAAGLLAGEVTFRTCVELAVETEVADARIGGKKIGDGLRAIVDDDELKVGVILRIETSERYGDESAAIVRRHDATDERVERLGLIAAAGCSEGTECGDSGALRLIAAANLNEAGRCKVGACVAAAVLAVVGFIAAQMACAELVLVAMPGVVELQRGTRSDRGLRGTSLDVGAAGPHAEEAGAVCADVVIHLPACAAGIALVGFADGLNDLAADDVAEVGKTMERAEAAA